MNQLRRLSTAVVASVAALIAVAACNTKTETPVADTGRSAPLQPASDPSSQASVVTATKSCGGTTISGTGLGDLKIGMSVASVRGACRVVRDTTRLASEGQPARFIAVEFSEDTVEAEIVSDSVWRIAVLSPRFRTTDSVGVGTPLSRLLTLRDPRGITGEGQLFVISPDHCGLSFRLSDNGSGARTQNWDRAALKRLPSGTMVNKILIVGCAPS